MSYLKFVKHIFTVGFLNLLGIVQGLVFLSLITKILGAKDYGVWSQVMVTMSLMVSFTFLGLHEALIRFIPGEKDKEKVSEGVYSSFVLVFFVNLIIASFLILFSGYLSIFLKFDQIFIRLLSLIIIFESLNAIFLVVIRAKKEIGKYFWFVSFKMFLEIGLLIAMVLLGYGLFGAILSFLFIRIIIFLVLFFYIIKKIGFKFPNFSLIKKYLFFGFPTIADGISYWIITSSDRYLIGFFLGIIFVGYYAPAYSIAYILSIFIFPLSFVLSAVLPQLFDEDKMNEVKNYLQYSLKYFLAIIIPATFGISILSKQLLVIFSTKEIATNAYFVVPFIAASIFLYGVSYFFSQILILVKKTKVIASIWTIAAFLNLGLNIIFIPILGILGAAITTFIAYFCAFILMYYFAFREFQFKIEWGFVFKIFIASILMNFSILWFNPQGIIGLISAILSGAIIYLILMVLLKGFSKKEIDFLKNLIYEMPIFGK